MIFDLSSLGQREREITEQAIARCSFDFERLRPGLRQRTGRDTIPVEWADLSRFLRAAQTITKPAGAPQLAWISPPDHDHPTEQVPEFGHVDVHLDGDHAHGFAWRRRALGLAWYSGKVSVEASLVSDPQLATEVFLAEAMHMIDFFLLEQEPAKREEILVAYHGDKRPEEVGHVHDWFEEAGEADYADWCGESFMVGGTAALSDVVPRFSQFTHASTPEVIATIRRVLAPPVYGTPRGRSYHAREDCPRLARARETLRLSSVGRRRPCRTCRPQPV